jgi:hypothetical protein
MLIPCENDVQKTQLENVMSQLKSDMIIHIDQEQMALWVRNRNFSAIKTKFLKIINQNLRKPVKDVYFETLNY